ncbi:MAG: hypothetical protein Q4A28_04435 [Brachymonas sp.]|nr:hypothetical protein [Brachymonas sp.]
MKSRYALPVFFLTVAIFWLSLLLSSDIRFESSASNSTSVDYKDLEGIDSLALIHSPENERYYSAYKYIRYADQPHITVTVNNTKNSPTAIKHIFVRQGNSLIFQPDIQQPFAKTTNNDILDTNNDNWEIREIILPKKIIKIHSRGVELNIGSEYGNGEPIMNLPQLQLDMDDASIEIERIGIESLNIRSRYIKKSCTDKSNYSYRSGRIEIKKDAHVNQLFIESIYGYIELENSAAIKTMHLRTTPETSIELDRLGIYQRMRWEPLPTPPMPECETNEAASPAASASATAIKAQ